MKITVSFKTPDAVDEAIKDITDEDEIEKVRNVINKFVEYGEYIRVRFDTEKGTAEVIPV